MKLFLFIFVKYKSRSMLYTLDMLSFTYINYCNFFIENRHPNIDFAGKGMNINVEACTSLIVSGSVELEPEIETGG